MPYRCFLETEGYLVNFELSRVEKSKQLVNASIEFCLVSPLPEVHIPSISTLVGVTDLERLLIYFRDHISALKQDPDTESYPFVTMALGFQLHALAGEVRSQEDGEFSMRFMVNVGKANEDASATYIGGEAVVTLQSIYHFIASVEMALTDLGYKVENS